MTDKAVISGTFADFKLVKTRSAAQVIVEVPVENADRVLAALGGIPQPGNEKPVAIARLDDKQEPVNGKPKQNLTDMKRSNAAFLLCGQKLFQQFLRQECAADISSNDDEKTREESAATAVRALCNVNSRAQFDSNEKAAAKWDGLHERYQVWRKE